MTTRSSRPARRAARLAGFAAPLLTAALCSGCGYVTVLNAKDERPLASGRAVWRFGEAAGVEVQAARAHASATQQLSDLDRAELDGQSIQGPVALRHDATHRHAHLAYNHRMAFGSRFELEWMAGVAAARSDWHSTSDRPTDPQLSGRASWSGPMGGFVGRLNFNDAFALEGRVTGALALGDRVDTAHFGLTEFVLAWRPVRGLVLRGGYAQYASSTTVRPADTEQALRVRGPYFNLGVEF